jgi:deazaflavin-dependent oxidoreductase (nitroreductase family)
MDTATPTILDHDQVIDLTTTGRRTGEPRRIEIYLHIIDGRLVISGMPSRRTRAWLRNVAADPAVTVHVTKGPHAGTDIPATARVVTDEAERRALLERVARTWRRTDVDVMNEYSPLIELTVDGAAGAA